MEDGGIKCQRRDEKRGGRGKRREGGGKGRGRGEKERKPSFSFLSKSLHKQDILFNALAGLCLALEILGYAGGGRGRVVGRKEGEAEGALAKKNFGGKKCLLN